MTTGAAANILTIHDRLVRLIQERTAGRSVSFRTLLQGQGAGDLGWTDAAQQAFLDGPVADDQRIDADGGGPGHCHFSLHPQAAAAAAAHGLASILDEAAPLLSARMMRFKVFQS
jgi:hypothetical protein